MPSSAEHRQAREHLANERTALAWVRTCATLVGLGFAVARFGVFLRRDGGGGWEPPAAEALGAVLVAAGALAAAAGLVRYLRARVQISRGAFAAEIWPEAALALVATALGVGVVVYLLASP